MMSIFLKGRVPFKGFFLPQMSVAVVRSRVFHSCTVLLLEVYLSGMIKIQNAGIGP